MAKKPDGYVSVMLLPLASAPPALVVNENVAAAPVFPATLSGAAIENEAFCTCPPIFPELTLEEAQKSFEVFTLTETERAVAAPMVIPLNVTVNGTDALIIAPDVKKTTDVALVTEHSMIKPCTLVSPTLTTGCTKGAKKLRGYVRVKEPGGMMDELGVNDRVADALLLNAIRSLEEILSAVLRD